MNTLFYGDNLEILKNSIKDETVGMIYLDPIKVKLPPNVIKPFKKNELKKNQIKQDEIDL